VFQYLKYGEAKKMNFLSSIGLAVLVVMISYSLGLLIGICMLGCKVIIKDKK
jgi:hypothetical protein